MEDAYQNNPDNPSLYDDNAPDEGTMYDDYDDDSLQPLLQTEEDYLHGIPLLSWIGPGDLPEEENRRWFMLIILINLVFFFVSILTKNFLLTIILMLVSLLTYMLSRIPSQELEHTITSTGVFTNNKFYPWNELSSFWVIKDRGHYVLGLDTNRRFFASEPMLLGNQNPMEVKEVLLQFLPQNENKEQDAINNSLDTLATVVDTAYQAIKERFFAKQQPSSEAIDNIEQIIASTEEKDGSGIQEQLIVEEDIPSAAPSEPDLEPMNEEPPPEAPIEEEPASTEDVDKSDDEKAPDKPSTEDKPSSAKATEDKPKKKAKKKNKSKK